MGTGMNCCRGRLSTNPGIPGVFHDVGASCNISIEPGRSDGLRGIRSVANRNQPGNVYGWSFLAVGVLVARIGPRVPGRSDQAPKLSRGRPWRISRQQGRGQNLVQ